MSDIPQETRDIVLSDIAPKGDAIGEIDGLPAFVARGIPGERVRVRIRGRRKGWIATDLLQVLEPSEDRVAPRCPLFELCAGCQLQHVAYPRQLALKKRMVETQLAKFGDFHDAPVSMPIGAPDPWHYRNHARFTIRDGRLGFVRRYRREFLDVPQCPIMDPRINEVLAALQGELRGRTQCNVRVGEDGGETMIQPRMDPAPAGLPTGQSFVFETLHGRRFRVSAASFFQVHRAQAERVIDLVREAVGVGPDRIVLDAYAGVGTFAALLAPHVGKVVAIEESGPAIEDAKINVADLPNVQLVLGKTELVLAELPGRIDAVILDPPRSGCFPGALEAVLARRPETVVYVSCDPATLARDLRVLVDGGYALERVQPVDMFPHTLHVECVATLRLPT
jgi:23S rRNA (uracil1939-C5)-methyltransferase